MPVELLAFDIGGVLAIRNKFFGPEHNNLFNNDFLDLQRGKINAEYYLNKKNLDKTYFQNMISAHDNMRLLKHLRLPYIFASNINSLHYDKFIQEAKPSAFALKNSALSYELGYLKPDQKFFKLLENKIKLPTIKILFIDDKLENVHAALARGLSALWCETPSCLPGLLKSYINL